MLGLAFFRTQIELIFQIFLRKEDFKNRFYAFGITIFYHTENC